MKAFRVMFFALARDNILYTRTSHDIDSCRHSDL